MGTLSGEATLCHFHGCLPFKLGSSHEGKNLLQSEQIHSFKSRSHLEKIWSSGQANRMSRKLSPFENMAEKVAVYPLTLKIELLMIADNKWEN